MKVITDSQGHPLVGTGGVLYTVENTIQRVAYLESSPTSEHIVAYTNPGGNLSPFEFEIRMRFPTTPSSNYIGSGYTFNIQFFVGINSNASTGIYMCFAENSTDTILRNIADSDKNGWHTYRAVSDGTICTYYVDGEQLFQHNKTTIAPSSFLLFAMTGSVSSVVGRGQQQIDTVKFIRDSVPILDLVPIRIAQKGYMYNRVSDTLLEGTGGDPLIIGPDV